MDKKGRMRLFISLWLVCLFVILAGCGKSHDNAEISPEALSRFEAEVDALVAEIVATQYGTDAEFAPVAVVPGAIKNGVPYTHLEEVVADALKNKLQRTNDLYVLTSQNWFEYREGRPLSFVKNSGHGRDLLRQMNIYEVRISPEPLFATLDIEIVVSDADGHILQGKRAKKTIEFTPDSPAARLNGQAVNRNPFPEGIEERPFTSIDRFAFSLVADLIDTYESGVLSSGRQASEDDVQVVLSVSPTTLVSRRHKDSIVKAVQHAIIRAKGVTCVLSPQDSRRNKEEVARGTVQLVIDLDRPGQTGVIAVAMRGVWRVSPLETASGGIVDEDLAGTYLSGFTAKGYLKLAQDAGTDRAVDGGAGAMMVCFKGADDVLIGDSYRALRHVPGLKQLERVDCAEDGCGCWSMTYEKSANVLAGWLRRHLTHYTEEGDYSVRFKGSDSINVLYNGAGR